MEKTTTKPVSSKERAWEIKDRTYVLSSGKSPLTYKIRSTGLLWFDEEKGVNREIRYAINSDSPFRDEQDEYVRLGHIVFEDGMLFVPKNRPALQKILSIYHPQAGEKWFEIDEQKDAIDQVDRIEFELEALKLVQELDLEHITAILRTELGGNVSQLSSKELKRDAYSFARRDPKLFTELANDEDIKLRNLANRAVEGGILELTDDSTIFRFKKNKKKVITVPFDQHPYAALAQFFKTDDGVDLMKSLMKKLN